MKKTLIVLLCVLAIALPVFSQVQIKVKCFGSACCTGGPRQYTYDVSSNTGGTTISELLIGTCNGAISNYSNWIMPAGWNVQILNYGGYPHNGYTTKGNYSTASGNCTHRIRFYGQAVTLPRLFAFNNGTGQRHDVGWQVSTSAGPRQQNWGATVGDGFGPVHSPEAETP